MNKEKTIKRLIETGWELQSAHEVWNEIALAVQQERERLIHELEDEWDMHSKGGEIQDFIRELQSSLTPIKSINQDQ